MVRQAVRLLEHHQIAKMRRGPGGGLFVLAPSPNVVADIVALYLEYQGVTVRELFEVRLCVELAVVDLAIERLTPESTAELVEALQLETSAPPGDFSVAAHDLHIVLASLSGIGCSSCWCRSSFDSAICTRPQCSAISGAAKWPTKRTGRTMPSLSP